MKNYITKNRSLSLSAGTQMLTALRSGYLFLEEDKGAGAAGGANPPTNPTTPPATTPSPAAPQLDAEAIAAAFKKAVGDKGAENLARELYMKNQQQRDEIRQRDDQIRATQLPEGSIVLNGDDVAAWNAYKALGKADEVSAVLEQAKTDRAKLAEVEHFKTLEKAAKAEGLKPGLLKILGKGWPVVVEQVDVASDSNPGQFVKVERAFVVTQKADKTQEKTPLRDFAKAQGEDVLDSLEDQQKGDGFGGNNTFPNQPNSIPFPDQGGNNGKAPVIDFAGSVLGNRYGVDKNGQPLQK